VNAATLNETASLDLQLEPRGAHLPAVQQRSAAPAVVVTPADLLRIAMETDSKDLDRLERLMAMDERYREMQERDRQRNAMLASKRDFAAFRGANIIIPKGKEVDRGKAGKFMQAEYDDVCARLSPALSQHGFAFRHDQRFGVSRQMQDGVESDCPWVWVTCFLEHRDGHTERLDLEGPPGDLFANTPVQNMQATASYLKRVSLLAITGTATGGEDDEARLRNRDAGGDTPPPPAAPEAYTAEQFAKNLPDWTTVIETGRKTADGLIQTVETRGRPLTDEQKAQLRRITQKV
jgi:hypothetical protein